VSLRKEIGVGHNSIERIMGGSAFGTPLFEPFGEIRMLTTEVIVITRE